ncbi:MAG: hypothetical protein IJZ57_00155 [Clostridia bacterium]|nr:hypothetical protein [Clostridia bacterium]
MKMFKRVLSLLLVSCLLFCAMPTAFAAESADTTVTEEEDILDNPIFSGAVEEIIASFIASLTEIFNRYVEIIKTLLASLELPEMNLPVLPEAPDAGDDTDAPSVEEPAEGESDDAQLAA